MAVGELLQFGFIGVEIIRRTALCNEQAERLLVQLRLLAEIAIVCGRVCQDATNVVEITPVPDPQTIAQAMHFAKAGLGRQRHGVDVAQHDLAPHRAGILALPVGAQGGRHHLLQFFPDR